jgi:molybdopterin converting factor small subunit
MNTAALREQISRAHQHEATTGQLAQQLEKQLPHLHSAISLVDGDRNIVMTRFVTAYIDLVPDLLEAANDVAREAGIESQIKPVLKIAEHFFLQPPAILAGHEGLDSLLDEAYLAHRLVEEVNDLYIKHFGQPLIPADTTVANLIAHQLIGEDFANQLDEAVHLAVDEMLNEESFVEKPGHGSGMEALAVPVAPAWSGVGAGSADLNLKLNTKQMWEGACPRLRCISQRDFD